MADILIIDDEPFIQELLSEMVERLGHTAYTAGTLDKGMAILKQSDIDLVFLDINLPDGDGLESLLSIRQSPSNPDVIVITAVGSSKGAAIAIQNGAWDYITKPFEEDKLNLQITRATDYRKLKEKHNIPVAINVAGIIGETGGIKACIDQIAECATSKANILISGETGTGKELFAKAIHNNHHIVTGNYIVVDCSALPENLVESVLFGHVKGAFTGADRTSEGLIKKANQGTLFLDEIGELPLPIQKRFLRVLQEKRFRPVGSSNEDSSDFHLISATNRNLDEMVRDGKFRKDLLYRLKTVSITLPPLRDRKEDIQILTQHYIRHFCKTMGIKTKALLPETLDILEEYSWPGNVRELVNAIEKAVMTEPDHPILYPMFLPDNIRINFTQNRMVDTDIKQQSGNEKSHHSEPLLADLYKDDSFPPLKEFREETIGKIESIYLKSLLDRKNWDISEAVSISGIGKSHLYALIKKYKLKRKPTSSVPE
ncbi:sigma-54-dependent transcriptional regulator [Desulforhopalus sp. 52FAK]